MVEYVKLKKGDEDKPKPQEKQPIFTFKRILITIVLAIVVLFLISSCTIAIAPKVAIVPIDSEITTTGSQSLLSVGSASSREIANQIYTLADDTTVQAIILDINSPGGSPVASDEISQAIEYAKEQKKVYSVISDLGASGAYWIAASTDEIYAAPLSIVGSIGVTSAGLSFEKVIEQYNITYRRQIAGEYKDMGSIFRPQTEDEAQKMQELLDSVHEDFITHIAESRNMSVDQARELATGEIFLGKDAKELGLVDELGYMKDVVTIVQNDVGNETLVMTYNPITASPSLVGIESLITFNTNSNNVPINLK